jgi:hypothetical protein
MWFKYSCLFLSWFFCLFQHIFIPICVRQKKEYDDNFNHIRHIRHKRTYKKILNKLIILIWFKKIKYESSLVIASEAKQSISR